MSNVDAEVARSAMAPTHRRAEALASRLVRAALAVAVGLLLSASSVPRAANDPRVVYVLTVATAAGADALAVRAGQAARAELAENPTLAWEEVDRRYRGFGEAEEAALARADEALSSGRRAYLELRYEDAVERLAEAALALDEGAAALDDPAPLHDALLFLVASHTFAGDRRAARAAARALRARAPELEPDPHVFNPSVIRVFQSARMRRAPVSLSIQSEPPGAWVSLDHTPRGRAPLTVADLPAGPHLLELWRPSRRTVVQRMELAGDDAVTIELPVAAPALEAALEEAATADPESLRPTRWAEPALEALELDQVGLLRVSPAMLGQAEVELSIYDAGRARRVLRATETALVSPGRLEATVRSLVRDGFALASPDPPSLVDDDR